jgi:hypothetical protein
MPSLLTRAIVDLGPGSHGYPTKNSWYTQFSSVPELGEGRLQPLVT